MLFSLGALRFAGGDDISISLLNTSNKNITYKVNLLLNLHCAAERRGMQ
jgi:hypothetical protein